ncbi:hypothetical protein evm_009902 [Chilo suppressalis]|nr:hypothetical protein evm_009902 [Chilo suppressalis]
MSRRRYAALDRVNILVFAEHLKIQFSPHPAARHPSRESDKGGRKPTANARTPTFRREYISPSDVRKIAVRLNRKKAPGPNELPPAALTKLPRRCMKFRMHIQVSLGRLPRSGQRACLLAWLWGLSPSGQVKSTISEWGPGAARGRIAGVGNTSGVVGSTSEQHADFGQARQNKDGADIAKLTDWFEKFPPFPETRDIIKSPEIQKAAAVFSHPFSTTAQVQKAGETCILRWYGAPAKEISLNAYSLFITIDHNYQTTMKTSLIVLVAILALASCYEENPYYKPIRACGMQLARTLEAVCLPEKKPQPKPESIVDMCCNQECDISILQQYCYTITGKEYGK